jgi:hypothetical protein
MADTAAAQSAAPAGAPGTTAPQPGQQPPAPGQRPGETATQAQARMLKLVLDGKEVELPESQVVTNYRKGLEASKTLSKVEVRRQEALKAKAEADGIFARLKADPVGVLESLGIDTRGLSEKRILQEIELERMTPDQRRAHDLEQKLKQFETEKQKAEREKQEQAHTAEVERHKDEFANLFVQTMESLGLPKSSGRFVVPRMAQLYAQNEAAGLESSPEEMAAHVMRGLEAEHRGVLSGLDGDALLERLGSDVVRKVLGAHLARVNAKRRGGAPPPVTSRPATPAPSPENMDPRKGRWAHIEALLKGK